MYCPNCKQNFEGKFCPECGTKLIEEPQTTGAFNINLGDANAISGGINLTDRHDVTNIDNSVHNTTNNTTTVNNYQPEVFGASDVNIEELMEKAVEHYEDENYFKAFKIFNQIADKDIEALYYLGECYREGNGVMQDYDVAAQWYTKAASQGFPNAQYVLGRMLLEEEYGMQNIEKGLKTLNMAASQGNSDAMFYLGAAYLLGMYVEKDNDRAYHYFSKMKKDASDAVAYGYAVSCFENNPEKACEILKGANDRGSIDLDEMDELELAITKNGLLLWADILCKNICGYGKYDLGLKYYKFVSEHFGDTEAEERLKNLDNNGGFRNYGDYQSDGKGNYIINEGVKSLLKTEYGRSKSLIPDDAVSVVLPSSITSIGEYAFQGCWDSLEKVTIPDSIKLIDKGAFSLCKKLKSISILNSVVSIGEEAFIASGIENIVVPNSVTHIGKGAFENCEKLKNVLLPDSLESLEEETFRNCNMLADITLPDSIKKIGEGAFRGCKNLRNITLPTSLTEIEAEAFRETALKEIVIPEGVEFIGDEAFRECDKLEQVTLPSTLKTFGGEDVFIRSRNIKTINVPATMRANIAIDDLVGDDVLINIVREGKNSKPTVNLQKDDESRQREEAERKEREAAERRKQQEREEVRQREEAERKERRRQQEQESADCRKSEAESRKAKVAQNIAMPDMEKPETKPAEEKVASGNKYIKWIVALVLIGGLVAYFSLGKDSDVSDSSFSIEGVSSSESAKESSTTSKSAKSIKQDFEKCYKEIDSWGSPADFVKSCGQITADNYESYKDDAYSKYDGLKDDAYAQYEEIKDNLYDTYEKIKDEEYDKYEKVKDEAYEKYQNNSIDYNEYSKIQSEAYNNYSSIQSKAYNTYSSEQSAAYEEYNKIYSKAYDWFNEVQSILMEKAYSN